MSRDARDRAAERLAELTADGHDDPTTAEAIILRAVINGTDRAELAEQLAQVDGALAAVDAAVAALILDMDDFLELHDRLHVPVPWPFDTPPPPPPSRRGSGN